MAAVVSVCGAVGAGSWVSLRPETLPAAIATPSVAHSLPAVRRAAVPWARWTITEQYSAHGVLVLQVETTRLREARAIAAEISAPLLERFTEILIYFHRPGRPDDVPPRRVQWSRADGVIETIYAP